jgi:hypothetical protein
VHVSAGPHSQALPCDCRDLVFGAWLAPDADGCRAVYAVCSGAEGLLADVERKFQNTGAD